MKGTIDGLITSGQTDEAKEHADNFRLIDDVLGWGIEQPSLLHYGLEWKETTLADGSVVYSEHTSRKLMVLSTFLFLTKLLSGPS